MLEKPRKKNFELICIEFEKLLKLELIHESIHKVRFIKQKCAFCETKKQRTNSLKSSQQDLELQSMKDTCKRKLVTNGGLHQPKLQPIIELPPLQQHGAIQVIPQRLIDVYPIKTSNLGV